MTTKYVTYCTSAKPDCAFVPNAEVVLCLEDAALVVQPDPACGLDITTIDATICKAAGIQNGCQNWVYQYTFAYDDALITDPDRGLVASDITGFLCSGCLLDYIDEQISCAGTTSEPIVPVDTDSVDLTVSGPGSHTLRADVKISATAGNIVDIHSDGLYAAQTALSVVDTATVDLTSSGTAGHTLQADVNISADPANAISAHSDGIYAPVAVTAVNTGSGCVSVGATKAVRAASISGNTLTITGAPEHTSDEFYSVENVAGLGALGVGTYILKDITYTRTADACRGTTFCDHYGQVSNMVLGAAAQVAARTLTSVNGGPFVFSSESVYAPSVTMQLPVADYSRANPSTTIAAAGANQTIIIRFELVVTAVGGGVTHNSSDCAASSLRITR